MMQDARSIALRRANAEGWSRVSVTAVIKTAPQSYDVTLVVSR